MLLYAVAQCALLYAFRQRQLSRTARGEAASLPAAAVAVKDHATRTAAYFEMLLRSGLPSKAATNDQNRMTVLLFCVNTLDLLRRPLADDVKCSAVEWIYAMQSPTGGFDGSPSEAGERRGHIVATYSALVALVALGDDLKRVNRAKTLDFLTRLQRPDGSFNAREDAAATPDTRFTYCACASAFILGKRFGFDVDCALAYLARCQSYDGGFGMEPMLESHGGGCYTAVASHVLLGAPVPRAREALRFCIDRQGVGFAGRLNKPEDTCYGFWVGATIVMLGGQVDGRALNAFLDTTAHAHVGGYAKTPGAFPDPLQCVWCAPGPRTRQAS